MAEIATIARPYAEALFKAITPGDAATVAEQVGALAQVAALPVVRSFADNPKATGAQVFDVITSAVPGFLGDGAKNLLRAVIDNGRLAALPEIAAQFHALVNARSGVSDAVIESAFPIDGGQLAEVVATLEKRFARKLNATVVVKPELIGGIRVAVGDEVLDTSVAAKLEQMKIALVA
jgi:F-type H+-transporting ATPase subunit delta